MARTGDEMEQLRHRVQKIDDLWDEEKQNRFAKMPKDADHGECHARQIVERVADKHLRGISVEREEKDPL